jgi:hypothetical protein
MWPDLPKCLIPKADAADARARHGRLALAMDGPLPTLLPRALAALLACAAVLVGAATARADDAPVTPPQVRWPVGGPALDTALELGAAHWGRTPCGGRVAVSWAPLRATLNANSTWAYVGHDPYAHPSKNTNCAITLSTLAEWDWQKLCTVVVHEVGHLDGHDHSPDPNDVMYFAYVTPVADCVATPEPDPNDPVLSGYQTTVRAAPTATAKTAPPRAKRRAPPKAKRPASKASARPRRGH